MTEPNPIRKRIERAKGKFDRHGACFICGRNFLDDDKCGHSASENEELSHFVKLERMLS